MGYKEMVMSGIDLNDTQCCIGASDPTKISIWAHGKFHSLECPTLQENFFGFTPEAFDPPKKRCECGAASTQNPNLHAPWCPEYAK